MNTSFNTLLSNCLAIGDIHVGEGYGILTAVLIDQGIECYRAESDRGIKHTLLLLIAKVFNESDILKTEAEKAFPLPLSMNTVTLQDAIFRGSHVVIALVDNSVRIDRYCTQMPSRALMPKCHHTTGIGCRWDTALDDLVEKVQKQLR